MIFSVDCTMLYINTFHKNRNTGSIIRIKNDILTVIDESNGLMYDLEEYAIILDINL